MTTWILIAHRSGARLFQKEGSEPPHELWSLDHPDGRLMNKEIDTDRPGRMGERTSTGHSSMKHEQTSKEHLAEAFAKDIAMRLDLARSGHLFTELVLVAEASFLGLIKSNLTAPTLAKVTRTFSKDLAHVPALELKAHLLEMSASSDEPSKAATAAH